MRIVFVGNQGGLSNLAMYHDMATAMAEKQPGVACAYIVWLDSERAWLEKQGVSPDDIQVFDRWTGGDDGATPDLSRLERDYPDANWSAVVAAERAFTDYSFLFGAVGHRRESSDYTGRIVHRIISFFEHVIGRYRPTAFVCQTADTIFSLSAFKVASQHGIRVFAITPAWLFEQTVGEGGFLSNDEYMRCDRMIATYESLKARPLTAAEEERVAGLVRHILEFNGRTKFYERNRGVNFTLNVVSPNITRAIGYLRRNRALNADTIYIKIDFWQKLKANLLRIWRKVTTRGLMETITLDQIPPNSVLYAMHFQPEASTLAQGIYVSNQIALIENISKALPLTHTLIVKEHPAGRGRRPAWQYRHLASLPNVEFCDAPGKVIAERCDAVMTVTGTIGFESMVMGKPVFVFGRCFYDYADHVVSVEKPSDLHRLLHERLIAKRPPADEALLKKFLLSYLDGLLPVFPFIENAAAYGVAVLDELASSQSRPRDRASA